jgi:hypothetical protein
MNKHLLLPVTLLFALLFSCKRPPVASTPPPPAKPAPERVDVKNLDFAYFKSKSKITYTDASSSQSATVDIRVKRDSVIWLSINKVGIEGARTLITRDSIFILDRLNNELLVYDFPTLSKRFNFPVSFDFLQAAMLGNTTVEETPEYDVKVIKEPTYYILRQNQDSVTMDNYVDNSDQKLKRVSVVEKSTNNSLNIQYESFTPLESFLFPMKGSLTLNYQLTGNNYHTAIQVEHQKAEISDKELKFPFAVPPKYERKQ